MVVFYNHASTKKIILALEGYGALQSCYGLCMSLNAPSRQQQPLIIPKVICKVHACWN
jgi:hypothetical protein